ncbi:MAG: glycosyltransferase family 9 protein [Candidatus Omnitrophica bacterium]|nr:glycosyltransferase family 9 protein [Candidatus Omnitrophota bacterium]
MHTRSSRKHFAKRMYLAARHMLLMPFFLLRRTCIPHPADIKVVAVLRYDRIGDMVITTPLFEALKDRFPHARLIVVASASNKAVIEQSPFVDEIALYQGLFASARLLKRRKVDMVIDPFYTYELKQPLLAFLSGARYRLGFQCGGRELFFTVRGPAIAESVSMSRHLAGLAACLQIRLDRFQPRIFFRPKEISWARDYISHQCSSAGEVKVAIHPGAFYPSQRWSPGGFAEVGRRILSNYDAHIFLVGDRTEEMLLTHIQDRIWHERVTVFCDMDLRHVAALLGECDLLICNNSGLLHIASALGIPTVSTMGPSDPVLWQPHGRGHIVIRHKLPCSPCTLGECKEHWCMHAITVDEVERMAEQQIARAGKR